MRRTVARIRWVGRLALTAVLWWPWLSPVVVVVLLAGASQLGAAWLVWSGVGVGLVGLGALLGLAYLGCVARREASPTGP